MRAKMPMLFAADSACGQEMMFSRRIYNAEGLAPGEKADNWKGWLRLLDRGASSTQSMCSRMTTK